ncbi:MAG: galactose-1-phosphate uridylyltransferase [Pseudomonadota bacterium]
MHPETTPKLEHFEPIDGRAAYRQRHVNRDGREVFLYSFDEVPHTPVGEGLEKAAQISEIRRHPLRGDWAVYAAARQGRTFKPSAADDPLAPMQPGGAATEIPFTDFEIAVFENRFPSLSLHQDAASATASDGVPANGRCEVVVFGPEAEGSLASIGQDRRRLLTAAWIDRYEQLFALGLDYILPFENRGDAVGVTLPHPHGQIYAFAETPPTQARAVAAFADGYDLASEIAKWTEDYWIEEAGGMVAFCPPFARYPYETWIAPRTARAGPWAFSEEEFDGFAHLLGETCRRYDAFFGTACPYMLSLHAAPRDHASPFHFTAQFYPIMRAPDRLKYFATIEHATGVFTVDVMPEAAAAALRNV